MLKSSDRRRISDEEALRPSFESGRQRWWQIAAGILNSPIVIAVVVTSMLGIGAKAFERSEECAINLDNANRYYHALRVEVVYRIQTKLAAIDPTHDVTHALEDFRRASPTAHNREFSGISLLSLIDNQTRIERGFGIRRSSIPLAVTAATKIPVLRLFPFSFPVSPATIIQIAEESEMELKAEMLGSILVKIQTMYPEWTLPPQSEFLARSTEALITNIQAALKNLILEPEHPVLEYDCSPWTALRTMAFKHGHSI
jgi:hypothetical protein